MLVTLNGVQKNLTVTSVVLGASPDVDALTMFHCPVCTYPIAQYQGEIFNLMPGRLPIPLPLITMCVKCKHRYAFHAVI